MTKNQNLALALSMLFIGIVMKSWLGLYSSALFFHEYHKKQTAEALPGLKTTNFLKILLLYFISVVFLYVSPTNTGVYDWVEYLFNRNFFSGFPGESLRFAVNIYFWFIVGCILGAYAVDLKKEKLLFYFKMLLIYTMPSFLLVCLYFSEFINTGIYDWLFSSNFSPDDEVGSIRLAVNTLFWGVMGIFISFLIAKFGGQKEPKT